jgi:uncharacterized protein YgiM (DUF1202 family)
MPPASHRKSSICVCRLPETTPTAERGHREQITRKNQMSDTYEITLKEPRGKLIGDNIPTPPFAVLYLHPEQNANRGVLVQITQETTVLISKEFIECYAAIFFHDADR